MDISVIIIALGLLIFFSHIFSALFVKTRIPNVLLLMLVGLLIGPVLHLISPADLGQFGSVFTTVTLIVILFESGTNLNPQTLRQSIGKAALLTVLNFISVLLIAFLIGYYLLDLTLLHSLFLGAAVGGTSSAVVVSMLSQIKPGPKAEMILFLESALSDILCLVVALAVMGGIRTGAISIGGMFKTMGVAMLASLLAGFAVGTIWLVVLKKWLKYIKNSMFTSFALAFIIYGTCESIGWNGGLAILAFGLTLSNIGSAKFIRRLFALGEERGLNQEERNFYSEIVFVLQTYFFVYIGVSIQLNNVWHLIVGALLVVLVFLLRPLTAKAMGRRDVDDRDRRLMAALGPKGLVAAVLASLPLQYAQQYAADRQLDGEAVQTAVVEALDSHSPFHRRRHPLPSGQIQAADTLPSPADTLELLPDSFALTVPATTSPVSAPGQADDEPGQGENDFEEVVELCYNGQTVQNVAYAVVLFSIILCSVMVAFIESKGKKRKAAASGPDPGQTPGQEQVVGQEQAVGQEQQGGEGAPFQEAREEEWNEQNKDEEENRI